METEQQPTTVEPPIGDQGGDPGQVGDQQPDGGGQEPVQDPGQQQPGQPGPDQQAAPNRRQRRDTFNENRDLKRALDELTRQNQNLNRQLEEHVRLTRESVEAVRPKPVDPFVARQQELKEKWDKVVARLDKDPSAAQELRDLQFEIGDMAAERHARQAAQQQQRPERQGPSAYQQSINVDFPWLENDREAQRIVEGEVVRIARLEKRDLRDRQVLYTTYRQAAAKVAGELGFPVPTYGGNGNGNGGRERFAGTGGRGGPGGGGAPDFNGFESDIAAAARVMYPQLTEAQAVAKWKASQAGRELAAARARR